VAMTDVFEAMRYLPGRTLDSGSAGPDANEILAFRNAIKKIACPKGMVDRAQADVMLAHYAAKEIWGPRRDLSLAEAAARHATYSYGISPDRTPPTLLKVAEDYVDKALDQAPRGRMQRFEYERHVPLYGFLYSYVTLSARRLLGIGPSEPPVETAVDTGNPFEHAVNNQFRECAIDGCASVLRALSAELLLLDRAAAYVATLRLSRKKVEMADRAMTIIRGGLEVQPGFCLMLDLSDVTTESSPAAGIPAVPLRTQIAPYQAKLLGSYGNNPSSLRKQTAGWLDDMFTGWLQSCSSDGSLLDLLQIASDGRAEGKRLLAKAGEAISDDERRREWLGSPKPHHGLDEEAEAEAEAEPNLGIGIADLDHLFGLLDPSSSKLQLLLPAVQ
jgi:hypothetical protein